MTNLDNGRPHGYDPRSGTHDPRLMDSALLPPGWSGALDRLRGDRRMGAGVTVLAAGSYGVLAGWWTPRGPITTTQAVAAIVLGLSVGAVAGWAIRTRWAMLLAPVTFVAVFELVRHGEVGATVAGVHVGSATGISTYGTLALVLGRGIHGLLAIVPLLLGAALGAAAGRRSSGVRQIRRGWARAGLWSRRTVTAFVSIGLLTLTLAILRPAHTDPIRGADGRPLTGSVAELTRVPAGGHDLGMMIRGNSVSNPVLLFLAGGPGGTEIGAMRRHGQLLERNFVVATLEQRGAGKSYDTLDPTSTLTLANALNDTIEVTNYLRVRFHQNKIYIVGNSWGTILGVLAVQQHPELYRAFIGTGQMVDIRETDQLMYTDTLAWARRTNNTALVGKLAASGPPPYQNMLDYEPATLLHENEVYPYDHRPNAEGAGGFSENLFVGEYSLMQQIHNLGAFLDVATVLYPQLQTIDLRKDVTRLAVPVYFAEGRYEARGRAEPFQQWFKMLSAPHKQLVLFDTSGHRPLFEQPELFNQMMTKTVLPQT